MSYTASMATSIVFNQSMRWLNEQYTFSIPVSGSYYSYLNPDINADLSFLNSAAANLFRESIAAWDELIAPNFVETNDLTNPGNIRISISGSSVLTNNTATARLPPLQPDGIPSNSVGEAGDIFMWSGNDHSLGGATEQERIWNEASHRYTFLHEIGHALGLIHPFEVSNFDAEYDLQNYTVMSYNRSPGDKQYLQLYLDFSASDGRFYQQQQIQPSTPGVIDIAAIQSLYGADLETRKGNTTYSWDNNHISIETIYDAGGTDTFDLSAVTRRSIIDLTPGA